MRAKKYKLEKKRKKATRANDIKYFRCVKGYGRKAIKKAQA